jgi:hypothetical protein
MKRMTLAECELHYNIAANKTAITKWDLSKLRIGYLSHINMLEKCLKQKNSIINELMKGEENEKD